MILLSVVVIIGGEVDSLIGNGKILLTRISAGILAKGKEIETDLLLCVCEPTPKYNQI